MSQEFAFTSEHLMLRKLVHDFATKVSPEDVVRKTMDSETGVDRKLWKRLGSDLGVLGVAAPEEYGGGGVGLVDQAIVLEEFGEALLCGPVVGTLLLAIPALIALSDESVKADYLPALLSGKRIATLAGPLALTRLDPDAVTVTASRVNEVWKLNGNVHLVPDGDSAELMLVPAHTPEGVVIFAVEADDHGVDVTPLHTMDLTRRQADVTFDDAAGRVMADASETTRVYEQVLLTAAALLAAEQIGVAQKMLDVTVEYARNRVQFGQPIGAFQAVKHRCANMLVELEQARSAAYHAIWALQDDTDDPWLAVSLARASASEAATFITASAIQLHGGIGFTWDGSPHLYFKRASTDALLLGSVEAHIDQLAGVVLDHA